MGETGSRTSPQDGGEPGGLSSRLREFFDLFVLFHLGSNATVDWRWSGWSLEVRVEHERIKPLVFRLEPEQIRKFSASQEAFEDFLLKLLTRHRKS